MRTRTDYTQLWDQVYGGKPLLTLMWGASRFRVRVPCKNIVQLSFVAVAEKGSLKSPIEYSVRSRLYLSGPTVIRTMVYLVNSKVRVGSFVNPNSEGNVRKLEVFLGKSLTF